MSQNLHFKMSLNILNLNYIDIISDFGIAALPQIEIRRWRKNPIPSRPIHAHWDRLVLLELGKPVYVEPNPTTQFLWKNCPKTDNEILQKQRRTANELEKLYAKGLKSLVLLQTMSLCPFSF